MALYCDKPFAISVGIRKDRRALPGQTLVRKVRAFHIELSKERSRADVKSPRHVIYYRRKRNSSLAHTARQDQSESPFAKSLEDAIRTSPKPANQIQQHRQHDADQDTRRNRKKDPRVLPFITNIPRKPPHERKKAPAAKIQHHPQRDNHQPRKNKNFPDRRRIHNPRSYPPTLVIVIVLVIVPALARVLVIEIWSPSP